MIEVFASDIKQTTMKDGVEQSNVQQQNTQQQQQKMQKQTQQQQKEEEKLETNATDNDEPEDAAAQAYLDHLLRDGSMEGDSGAKMEMPSWYNEQLFKLGQTTLSKYRFVMTSGMLAGLVAVLAIPSILKVLICTRQSGTNVSAYRRYVRTIFHTTAWYDYSPDSKDSKFWTSLRAVRKTHSRSSHACAQLGAGKITQKDLAITQFGFIGFITLGAPRIQLYDQDFLESTSHMWRVLGYLLGIKDEYNICGENWNETKQRLDIVMRKVFVPALERTDQEFEQMTSALLNGLWPVNTSLTVGSFLFFTKRLAYVEGYEYYDFDVRPGKKINPAHPRYYNELGWWDRFVVSYGLFIVTYLHKYSIVRWYLNLRVWLNTLLMHYLPYIAMWMYGIKAAYVSIFTKEGEDHEFQFHLKED